MQEEFLNEALFITGDTLIMGDDKLGLNSWGNFLITLSVTTHTPKTIFLLNNAAKLTAEGSMYLDELGLPEKSCRILSSLTRLELFDIKDKLRVGSGSNMKVAVKTMENAAKVTVV